MSCSVYERLEAEVREVRRMRDEVRVKIHLAGMDAKAALGQLEHRLVEIERSMTVVGRGAAAEIVEALERLNAPFRRLRDSVRTPTVPASTEAKGPEAR
jgi:transcriptional regulator of NAD metabolism